MSRPLAGLAAALLCTGCALATATPPQVEVTAVQVRGIGLLDQTLGVTLCVTNPNNSELAFRRIQVVVDAAGSPLAEGASEVPVRLPPRSSVLVPFTVVSTVRNLVPQLLGVLSSGAVEYRLHGSITLETLGITVPFSRSGRFGLLAAGQELLWLTLSLRPVCAAPWRHDTPFPEPWDGTLGRWAMAGYAGPSGTLSVRLGQAYGLDGHYCWMLVWHGRPQLAGVECAKPKIRVPHATKGLPAAKDLDNEQR